ncbi:MAG: T9SS type A sorting domain-containing protein, partial [Vicingus serpentipes]|nr:T9SS type A sorting domain-containing protein [Vicingus serpentipes]
YTYLQVDQREYLQVSLKDSLIANSKYYVSLYVALTKSSKYAIDSLGIYFSNDSVISASLEYLSLSPQVSSGSNFVTDTSWQKISDTLIANGGEKYLIIGNFSSDNQTSVIDVGGSLGGGYYFIDDVSVTLIDSIVGIAEKRNENTTIIYPNPTKGAITMSLSKAPHEASALIIYNVLGEQVENIPIRGINTQLILQQPAGVYFYHFKIKQEVVSSGKLIISH